MTRKMQEVIWYRVHTRNPHFGAPWNLHHNDMGFRKVDKSMENILTLAAQIPQEWSTSIAHLPLNSVLLDAEAMLSIAGLQAKIK